MAHEIYNSCLAFHGFKLFPLQFKKKDQLPVCFSEHLSVSWISAGKKSQICLFQRYGTFLDTETSLKRVGSILRVIQLRLVTLAILSYGNTERGQILCFEYHNFQKECERTRAKTAFSSSSDMLGMFHGHVVHLTNVKKKKMLMNVVIAIALSNNPGPSILHKVGWQLCDYVVAYFCSVSLRQEQQNASCTVSGSVIIIRHFHFITARLSRILEVDLRMSHLTTTLLRMCILSEKNLTAQQPFVENRRKS